MSYYESDLQKINKYPERERKDVHLPPPPTTYHAALPLEHDQGRVKLDKKQWPWVCISPVSLFGKSGGGEALGGDKTDEEVESSDYSRNGV